ncbi:MAG TPA: 4'-phosphopantetheinyl transferase superfamily protein [Gemmatimonadaceae bacterium]|jgi:4'-phosphopantetheinyl transferase|nr:4'-phosphopantetheinyl transferase superfamily protein [Gemmatimonadaceae bacterium]
MSDESLRVGFSVWPHASVRALLDRFDVLVCSASLVAEPSLVADALAVLAPIERERYEQYENSAVARRFAIGRLRLRELLGALLGLPAATVPIQIGLHGKPALSHGVHAGGLRFSVAHCEELLLVAVTRIGDVGIDVERVRPIERWARVADRVFAPAERAALGREVESGEEPSAVFFRHWCRGEAELKAIGCGISGLGAHRDGWHPAGLKVVELSAIPLPNALADEGVRYQGAVAVCTPRDAARQSAAETSQLRPPRNTPTSASTA